MQIPEEFKRNYPLKSVSSFGIGGPAKFLTEIKTIEKMQEAVAFCTLHQIPYHIVGKGSNSLFDDKGFDGLVIVNKIDFLNRHPTLWHVGAGYSFSLLGTQTARSGLTGLEFASGIPASVGGAIFMNAGANGRETCDSLVSIDYLNEANTLVVLKKEEISFAYRYSGFQEKQGIIVGATFQLSPCEQARQDQIHLIQYRQKTQPYGEKSAGCVFRNPPGLSAGALIDRCGLKGLAVGGAEVSEMHANFLINKNEACQQDVLDLITLVREKVKIETGIELESEVRYIPYTKQ